MCVCVCDKRPPPPSIQSASPDNRQHCTSCEQTVSRYRRPVISTSCGQWDDGKHGRGRYGKVLELCHRPTTRSRASEHRVTNVSNAIYVHFSVSALRSHPSGARLERNMNRLAAFSILAAAVVALGEYPISFWPRHALNVVARHTMSSVSFGAVTPDSPACFHPPNVC